MITNNRFLLTGRIVAQPQISTKKQQACCHLVLEIGSETKPAQVNLTAFGTIAKRLTGLKRNCSVLVELAIQELAKNKNQTGKCEWQQELLITNFMEIAPAKPRQAANKTAIKSDQTAIAAKNKALNDVIFNEFL